MKRTELFIVFILLFVISCSIVMPTQELPVYTPLSPTRTPDLCGLETISFENETVRNLLKEFQEVAYIASNTPVDSLIAQL